MGSLQTIKRDKKQYIPFGISLGVLIFILQVSEPLFLEFKNVSMEFVFFLLQVAIAIMLVKIAVPDFVERNSDLFASLLAKFNEKIPQKQTVTQTALIVRRNKYGNAESHVATAVKKLINANPKWRISSIVNIRSGFIHCEIKNALIKAGLAEKDRPPVSTLASWIRPHVNNTKSGKY